MGSSNVSSATKFFSTANEGFTTTTSGSVSSGGTTVGLTSVTGLTNATVFVGIIEPSTTKEQTFTGTVDTGGSQITGVIWTRGTNVDHSAGVTVVDYVTGTDLNLATKGILVEHGQDGKHTNITATSVNNAGTLTQTGVATFSAVPLFPDNTIETADIQAAAVTYTKLGTDSSFAWSTWVPTWANITIGNGINVARYTQIGKTVYYHLQFTWGSTTSISTGDTSFTLPVTAHSSYNTEYQGNIGEGVIVRTTNRYIIRAHIGSSTSNAVLQSTNTNQGAGAVFAGQAAVKSTQPTTGWTTGDMIELSGFYEAA